MSGNDERTGEHDDFFDWSYDAGSPIKVDCPDKSGHTDVENGREMDMLYFPWGCWGCEHVVGEFIMHGGPVKKCGLGHPTFHYRAFRRNNSRATNRKYHTLYRTVGD